jgi:hypothetical protein
MEGRSFMRQARSTLLRRTGGFGFIGGGSSEPGSTATFNERVRHRALYGKYGKGGILRDGGVIPRRVRKPSDRRVGTSTFSWIKDFPEIARRAGLGSLGRMLTTPRGRMKRKVKAPPTAPWDDEDVMSPFISSSRDG